MDSSNARTSDTSLGRGLILIPCFNEALSLPQLLNEVYAEDLGMDILVVNDGSSDETAAVATRMGVAVIDLPCNLGVGHAVQAGFQFGVREGYDFMVRIDGDGQHPPAGIREIIKTARKSGSDLVVGSRFGEEHKVISTRLRYVGIRVLAIFLSIICRSSISDPTSGFWLVRRELFTYFAHEFPTDYPEPEALAILRRQGYSFSQVAVEFRPRRAGVSSIKSWGTVYYALKVGLALLVDRVRPVNRAYAKAQVK